MNSFHSKLLAVAAAGFSAALCMTTTIGQAEVGVSDVVALTGTASITGNTDEGDGLLGCAGNYVCGVGGTGTYEFVSNLCEGVSDGDGTPPVPEGPAACTVSSTGSFTNIVCGSGEAVGSATVTEPDEVDGINYAIVFVGGVGVLEGSSVSLGDTGTAEDYVGLVDLGLIPGTQGNPAANQCVSGFSITNVDVALDLPVALPVIPLIDDDVVPVL